ncbi:MAG: PEP-CTERM sorting domain-containing protein [Rhodopirellula sp. JB055]|uniref:PEP-CTERM sorting domain-containing protein n=1 Tax=Rhodopirellula sp. JB055 TaxID=3342846 RepID=UPI00370AF2D4
MLSTEVAQAAVIGGNSSSDFLAVDLELDLLPLAGGGVVVDAQINGLAPASGTSPAPYNDTETVLGVAANAGNIPVISLGNVVGATADTVTSFAGSDVDGLPGSRNANSSHVIENLDLSVVELAAVDLISITADAITVTSAVDGDFGSLSPTGTMDVTNLQISVSGVQVGATLNGSIAANTGIDLSSVLGGASLILNEQLLTGDGISSSGLATNAISLRLTDVGVAGVGELDGNVFVGLTNAGLQASAVPEPSSLALLGVVGFGGACWRCRRKVAGPASQA